MALVNIARKLILVAGLLASAAAVADDIDLFKGGTPITGQKPNVLIIVDNSANWNRNDQGWPIGKQGESELQAMSNVIGGLTGDVRVGLMMFVKGTGSTKDGGYVRFAIRDMDATSRAAFQAMLSGIKPNFNDQNAGQQVASANADYGAIMYEAFKYFSNSTPYAAMAALRDYSGNGSAGVNPYTAGNLTGNAFTAADSTTYVGPLSSDTPCNKNFIIFIGNGFPSTSSVNPTTLGDSGLASFDATQIYNEGTKTTYLDEWARFLHKHGASNAPCDAGGICADGLVTTYTIDVYKDHQDLPQTSLLKSAASVGGGKYFAATSEAEIQDALTRILNEIQAVNSVFTSASLPVSVNTQGTYLNQIYMGVFRPDATGAPRWLGNLKQYKFNLTTDATGADVLFLADADGKAAVNSQTGFVDPSARSFWSKSTAPAAGFWAFSGSGAGGQYDAPDGDLVEKGGAAQMLRNLGPTARNVYTCTPNCTSGSTPPLFNSSNTSLVTALTSTSSSVTLSRSGTTVSATTALDLSLNSPTDTVNLNTNVPAYNASFTATKVDATHFTFPISETPVTPATGASITVSAGSSVSQSIAASAVTYSNGDVTVNLPAHGFINNQSVTIAGANVSLAMSSATTPCLGWTATSTCEYNGTFNITVINNDPNNFSYRPPPANYGTVTTTITGIEPPDPIASPYGSTTITCRTGSTSTSSTVTNSLISRPAGGTAGTAKLVSVAMSSVPATCTNPLVTTGNGRVTAISVSGTSSSALNITPASVSYGAATCGTGKHYCFNVTLASVVSSSSSSSIVPASPATGTITATGIPTRTVTSITRTAGNVATVTVTTATAHGFGAATSVIIAGADQTEYNGTKTVVTDGLSIPSGSNTMTFNLATGPATTATGTAARGTSIPAATLINWIRGVDNKEDENINSLLTDVRASVHGDVLHSRPLVINYGGTTGIYAFYGSNDGTFRGTKVGQNEAVGSIDGQESWSFVAPEHYSTLGRLYNNTPLIKYLGLSAPRTPRDYFFDGNIGVYQSADLATTHIFISMRRGGRFIYALDVSNPTAPKFLWKKSYTDTGFSELGYTWSEPKVVALTKTNGVACNASNSSTYVRGLVFGAGYDPASEDVTSGSFRPNATMGRGVFVVNAADGSLIKLLQPPANDFVGFSNSTRPYTFPSDVTLLDTNGDGCIDRIYVGDTGAKMHRFDIGDASSANWKAYTIAALGDIGNNGGSNDRKFLFPPEVVLTVISGSQVAYVMAGTGDREQPSTTAIDNRFYMIKDALAVGAAVATSAATTNAVTESQLTQISNFNASTTTIDATASSFKGWFIAFDSGEKSVNAPLTVAGTTFFGTNLPKAVDPKSCEANLGIARGYALNFLTGTSAFGDRTGNGNINKSDMYATFLGGGLPPSPVSGVVQINDAGGAPKTVRFIIGGGGTGTSGSVIEGTKMQVNPSGARTRVFWYFKKDD